MLGRSIRSVSCAHVRRRNVMACFYAAGAGQRHGGLRRQLRGGHRARLHARPRHRAGGVTATPLRFVTVRVIAHGACCPADGFYGRRFKSIVLTSVAKSAPSAQRMQCCASRPSVAAALDRAQALQVLALANAVGAATAMGTGAGRNVASPSLVMELLRREVRTGQHGGCWWQSSVACTSPSAHHN